MQTTFHQTNQFVVRNGKLLPRPTTPEQRKNYRYVPFDSLNNPSPQDYYRETIARLQHENKALKAELAEQSRQLSAGQAGLSGQQDRQMMQQIMYLRQQLEIRDREIAHRNQLLVGKDKQILQVGNENTRLHLKISNFVKEIDSLNLVMSKKDQEIMSKEWRIEEYCRILDRMSAKEKQEEKTMVSENHLTTPRIDNKDDDTDEFYSFEYNSLHDRSWNDRRYMTPEADTLGSRLQSSYHELNKTEQSTPNHKSAKSSMILEDVDRKSSSSGELNFSGLWGNHRSIMTLDLLNEQSDPLMGGAWGLNGARK